MNRIKTAPEFDPAFPVRYRYRTVFTEHLFRQSNPLFRDLLAGEAHEAEVKVFILIEESVLHHFPELGGEIRTYCSTLPGNITAAAPLPLSVRGTEECKTLETAEKLCDCFLKAGLCRQSFLVIIGGGALLDAAGFAASIFHRGVRQIRVPTTALSQCDSGVGVKNAVNAFGKKNLLGVFAPPSAVLCDSAFLHTLPRAAFSSAAAEAVKVATIKDAEFFHFLEDNAQEIMERKSASPATLEMIRRSAGIHIRHIATSGDPFEYGSARPLDFGHWAAHKIEMLSGGRIGHGEAVGMGLLIDTLYAQMKGIAPASVFESLRKLLEAFHLPFHTEVLEMRSSSGGRAVLEGIEEFREHLGGLLHITLPTALGSKTEVHELDPLLLEKAIAELIRLKSQK